MEQKVQHLGACSSGKLLALLGLKGSREEEVVRTWGLWERLPALGMTLSKESSHWQPAFSGEAVQRTNTLILFSHSLLSW